MTDRERLFYNENIDIFAEKLGENLKKVYICTKENLKKV